MRRALLTLALCLAVSPAILPAQTTAASVKPKKAKKVKAHKAKKLKKAKRPVGKTS